MEVQKLYRIVISVETLDKGVTWFSNDWKQIGRKLQLERTFNDSTELTKCLVGYGLSGDDIAKLIIEK